MLALKKMKNINTLSKVFKIMRHVKPLNFKQALAFYSAPLLWLAYGGRRKPFDLIPGKHLLVNSSYGYYILNAHVTLRFFHELHEIDYIEELVDRDTVFIDVGAYMGFYTIWACRRAGKVVSIEPNPFALTYLKYNISLNNCTNTIIVDKAVSNTRSLVEMRMPKPRKTGYISPQTSIIWNYEDAIKFIVEADTLDNILEENSVDDVDMVKIDVEGAEAMVVKGAEKTLRKARIILMEIWPENLWIIDYMRKNGYKLAKVFYYGHRNCIFIKY